MNRILMPYADCMKRTAVVALIAAFAGLATACSRNDETGPPLVAFSSPARVHDEGNGSLLVSDYRNRAVYRYTSENGIVYGFIATPTPPLAVAAAYERVYVGNESTGSIDVYDLHGSYRGILGKTPGLVKAPSDIAVDPAGYLLFAADSAGKDVKVFGLNGNLVRIIKGPASGTGRLMHPTAIAIDPLSQEVAVSDYGDPSNQDPVTGTPAGIHVYTYTGAYQRSILGSAAGFSRPQGLAIDDGHFFMADSVRGQVLVFDSMNGALLKTLGSFGSLDSQLFVPLDVVVDPLTKDVRVADNRNSRITVFTKGGVVP